MVENVVVAGEEQVWIHPWPRREGLSTLLFPHDAGAAVLGRVQGGDMEIEGEHPPSQAGRRARGWLILVGRGSSSAWRLRTWICCTMLRSWTRNSFASLALSDKPFRAWESWLCNRSKQQGHFHVQDSSIPLIVWDLGLGCSSSIAPSA